jgi:hypothetical protein
MQVSSEFNYLAQMIPHHQEAIDTAQVILARTSRPEMRQFAQNIIQAQTAEIAQMKNWLNQWYPSGNISISYVPMMRDLSQLQGDALDQTFLKDMIKHHMGAVMMSQMLLNHRKFWVGNPAVLGWLYVRIKKTVSKTKWADSTLKTRLREFRSEKLVRVKSRAQQVQEAFSQNRTVGHTESGF